jgi:hypothetical protein
MKKSLIFSAIAALSATAFADTYTMRVATTDKTSTWEGATATYSSWVNVGGHHDCSAWNPTPDTVNFGQSFLQNRTCDQDQERTATQREFDSFSQSYRVLGSTQEQRVAQETESQSSVGTLQNWGPYSSTFTSWIDSGAAQNYSGWTPVASNQVADFTQARTYSQPQERFEQRREIDSITSQIRDSGSPLLVTQLDPRSENRSISVTSGNWVDTVISGQGTWAPVYANQTADYTQTRGYTQHQERTWSYMDGASSIHSRVETKTLPGLTESQNIVVTASPWENSGAHINCAVWSPDPSTIEYGTAFTQSRDCDQAQTRAWTHKLNGATVHTRNEGQTITETETQGNTGTLQNWVATTSTFTSWIDSGSPYAHTTWAPVPASQTANFTQTRTYSQDKTRNEQEREVDTVSGQIRNVGAPIARSQTLTGQADSQTVTATATGWSNTTTAGYTAWSPAVASQTSNFTQSRTYTQNQSRLWTYKDPAAATLGTYTQTQGLTGQIENQTVVVSAGGWSNSGGHYSCGSWSPDPSTINYGTSFTQSRNCSQNQSRTWSYTVGGSSVGSRNEDLIISEGESQGATGTYQNWTAAASTYSAWTTNNTVLGTWTPAASSQTSNFTQTQSVTYNQSRTVQPRQYDTVTGAYRNSGSTTTEYQDVAGTSNTRTVTVTAGTATDTNQHSSCGTWSPATSTVNSGQSFTQTRTCNTIWNTQYTFSIGGAWTNSVGGTATESQNAIGTKVVTGTWSAGSHYGSSAALYSYEESNYKAGFQSQKSGSCSPLGSTSDYTSLYQQYWDGGNNRYVYYKYRQTCQ